MKKISFELKFLIGFVLIGVLMFGMLFIYKNIKNEKLKEKSFQFYEYHDLANNISNVSKTDLIDDAYLISLLRIEKYDGYINKSNVEDVMIYYLLNITKNPTEEITLRDEIFNFCMSTEAFKKSIQEFLGYDISESFDLFNNVSFIKYSNDSVCFDIGDEILYDYDTFIGVQSIETNGESITAKIYLYDYDFETESEKEKFKNNLINSINRNNLINFNKTLPYYKEKNIKFKEIPDGDFFKYQVLSITTK